MIKNIVPRFVIVTLIALVLISVMNAVAAGNIVPPTRLDDQSFVITVADFTPAACTGLGLTNVVTGSSFLFGTAGNDLILGSGGADWIFAFGGDDCIVSGGGDDRIWGGSGTNVCIGGPGNDTFTQCETEFQ
jgi:Ca2+-binding RTX toxin-like protein